MKRIIFIIFTFIAISNCYAQLHIQDIFNKVYRVNGLTASYKPLNDVLNAIYDPTNEALQITMVGDSINITYINADSVIVNSSLKIPTGTDVSANTGLGVISWDSDDNKLYLGTGLAVVEIGNTSGWTDSGTDVVLTTITDKVGIGITTPTYKLDIDDATGLGTTNLIKASNDRTGADSTFTVNEKGWVGIGIADADKPLHVITSEGGMSLFAGSASSDSDIKLNCSVLIQQTTGTTDNYGLFRFLNDAGYSTGGVGVRYRDHDATPTGDLFFATANNTNSITEKMYITAAGLVGVGTTAPDSNLTVENGAHFKRDVLIDGSLTVTGSESSHGEMKITGGGAYTINTTNAWHAYTGFSSEHLTSKITFDAGKSASDITAYATYDAGATTKITATAAHGLALGDIITITGTTNYNDVYEVQESVDANNFTIDKAWDTNDDATGTYAMPSCFIIGTNGAGDYLVQWTAGGSAAAADTYEFGIYHEKTLDHKIPRKFANNDVGSMAGGGIIVVADTDVIWFAVQNTTGTNNIDIDEMSFVIHKL